MTAPDNWSNVLEQLRMIQERLREESRKKEEKEQSERAAVVRD